MSSDGTITKVDQLKEAARLESEQRSAKDRVEKYVSNVKSTLLFQPNFNWGDLLSAAPVAISNLGAIFVLSTTDDAYSITVHPPTDGFKHLPNYGSDTSLNAVLVVVADQGRQAFENANAQMGVISNRSENVKDIVANVIGYLSNPDSAVHGLVLEIENLTDEADACEKAARSMSDKFDEWLLAVCELHATVAQTSTDTLTKIKDNDIHLTATQTRLKQTETAMKQAKENLDTAKETLAIAREAYKKASDAFPSGWDLIAQELVRNLSSFVTTTLKQVIPKLIDQYSWTAKAEEVEKLGENVVGDISQEGMNLFEDAKDKRGFVTGGTAGNALPANDKKAGIRGTGNNPSPKVRDPDSGDPALIQAGLVSSYATTLSSLVGKLGQEPAWAKMKKHTDGSGLDVVVDLIQTAQSGFKPGKGNASKNLTEAFATILKVATELQAEVAAQENTGEGTHKDPPQKDSEQVKGWQNSTQSAVDELQALKQKAAQLDIDDAPSTGPQGSDGTDGDSHDMDSYLAAAGSRLATAAHSLDVASDLTAKIGTQYVDLQVKYGDMLSELGNLKAESAHLGNIKDVLVRAITLLVELKNKVNKLVSFFVAIKDIVSVAVESQAAPFVKRLKANAQGEDTDLGQTLGGWSLSLWDCQTILNSALSIRCYFDLFKDIAALYIQVHLTNIEGGLDLVTELQTQVKAGDKGETTRKQTALTAWGTKAHDEICTLVNDRQNVLAKGLQDRALAANKTLENKLTPRLPASTTKKLEGAARDQKDAGVSGIGKAGAFGSGKIVQGLGTL